MSAADSVHVDSMSWNVSKLGSFRLVYEDEVEFESTFLEFQTSDLSRALALQVGLRVAHGTRYVYLMG